MADRKTYHHGDLRAALLVAAEAELEASGVEGFSLRKVARRAGVSHAAPAHHFGDVTGLLSALATEGYRRLLACQHAREENAPADALSQLKASGLGYVDFAMVHTALFRLVFTSTRLETEDVDLSQAGEAAFSHLVDLVRAVSGRDALHDPEAMAEVSLLWATMHGLGDLLSAGRLKMLGSLPPKMRDRMIRGFMDRLVVRP